MVGMGMEKKQQLKQLTLEQGWECLFHFLSLLDVLWHGFDHVPCGQILYGDEDGSHYGEEEGGHLLADPAGIQAEGLLVHLVLTS